MTKLLTNKRIWLALAVVGLGLYFFQARPATSERIEYQTAAISMGSVESLVNSSGTLSPLSVVQVGSEVSGLIRELNADFNTLVKEGDLLARIDDRDVLTLLRQREADLEVAKANLVQERAALIRAETDYEFALRELERTKSLLERRLVSETDLERSLSNARSSEAALENAKARIVSAEASILQRNAQLEQIQLDLERTYIRSPVDGIVIRRLVDLGQAVSANQSIPTLFEVAKDLSEMQIQAAIAEADIGRVQEGMPVRFRVDAYPDQRFTGVVSQVRKASTIISNVVTYTIIINADNPREILLPGMTANVDIVLGSRDNALRAPNTALRFQPPESVQAAASPAAAEPGAGTGGRTANGADPAARVDGMVAAMALTPDVEAKFRKAITDNQARIAAQMRAQTGEQQGFNRTALTNLRSSLENELRTLLTTEQFETYQGLANTRNGAGNTSDTMTSATLWVLRNGQPTSVAVRSGIADSQNTEIATDQLKVGDQVIVRAIYLAP